MNGKFSRQWFFIRLFFSVREKEFRLHERKSHTFYDSEWQMDFNFNQYDCIIRWSPMCRWWIVLLFFFDFLFRDFHFTLCMSVLIKYHSNLLMFGLYNSVQAYERIAFGWYSHWNVEKRTQINFNSHEATFCLSSYSHCTQYGLCYVSTNICIHIQLNSFRILAADFFFALLLRRCRYRNICADHCHWCIIIF